MAHETHGIISECAVAAAASLDQFVSSVDVLFEHADGEFREIPSTDYLPSYSGSEAHATPRHLMDAVAALDPAFRAMGYRDEHGRPMGKDYTGLWLNGHSITVEESWKAIADKLRSIGLAAADRYQGCRNREQLDSTQLMVIPADTRRWAVAAADVLRKVAMECGPPAQLLAVALDSSKKMNSEQEEPLRSWTQHDLDNAIREYKAQRAAAYRELAEGVSKGRRKACEAARRVFGRNVIANALRCRAPAMVSKSKVWQAMRHELQLSAKVTRCHRIGLEVAVERITKSQNLTKQVEVDEVRKQVAAMTAEQRSALVLSLEADGSDPDDLLGKIQTLAIKRRKP